MNQSGNKWRVAGLGVVLVGITVATFWPVLNSGFVDFDDPHYVSKNGWVQAGLTIESVRWAFTRAHCNNWHPITWMSHMLDCQLFGLDAGRHHLTNLILHATNGVLLFVLLHGLTGSRGRSAIVAALFALHPLHVESVAWIAERKDVLSAFFGILTLMAYTRYAKRAESKDRFTSRPAVTSPTKGISSGPQSYSPFSRFDAEKADRARLRRSWYALALILFALGLMSKPMLVTWPFVLLLLDFWPLNRVHLQPKAFSLESWKRNWRLVLEKMPFFALAIISCVITYLVQSGSGAVASLERVSAEMRITNAITAYAAYLQKMLWPADLAVLYLPPEKWDLKLVIAALAVVVVITLAVVCGDTKRRYLATGWFWYLGTLVPVIGLVQVGDQSMADRYTYLPLIGLFLTCVWGGWEMVCHWKWSRITAQLTAGGVILICAGITRNQVRLWQDSETLFTHCLQVTENNHVIHNHLGTSLLLQDRMDEAEAHYQESLRLRPEYADALNNMAILLTQRGQIGDAIPYLEEALRISPAFADAYGTMAMALTISGKYEQANNYHRQAIQLKPDLAAILSNNLAWVLATHSEGKYRNGPEAVRLARLACEISGYSETVFIGTLGAAYAEAGQFAEAIAAAQHAVKLAQKRGQNELMARNEELLKLFRDGQAYREKPLASQQ